MSKTCQNCRHGQVCKEDETRIECHFHAPQKLHGVGAGYEERMWPLMDYADWCAKFLTRR